MPLDRTEQSESEKISKEEARRISAIARTLGTQDIPVLASTRWGTHYPNGEIRTETLQSVLSGEISPGQVDIETLKPDGITYNIREVQTLGIDGLVGKIRTQIKFLESFNYQDLLDFLHNLKDKNVSLDTALSIYRGIAISKTQRNILKSMGPTGRRQMKQALQHELEQENEETQE